METTELFYTVDGFCNVIATYPSRIAANNELFRDISSQAYAGVKPGHLDYRTVSVLSRTELLARRAAKEVR